MKRLAKLAFILMMTFGIFASPNLMAQPAESTTEYCERAIDIKGIFCFIGCPSGCRCDVSDLYSQCCCDIAME